MAQKVKPIKVKEMRLKDIPDGAPFSFNGTKYVMIVPICPYDESLVDVRHIIRHKDSVSAMTTVLVPTTIKNDAIAYVSAAYLDERNARSAQLNQESEKK